MSKIQMNNEIVFLRHTVRQARVCVVNKLTKEVKLLQNKHGNEMQQEKFKKKANKLIAEIHALKTLKEDDISKFGIISERDLTKILQDQSLSDSARIMARIVHYKTLYKKITQFKKKFPYCKKYLIEEKKKTGKIKKVKTKTRNVPRENNLDKQDKTIKKREIPIDKMNNIQHSLEDEKNSELLEVKGKNISHKRKKSLDIILERDGNKREKLMETKENDMLDDEIVDEPNMTKLCCVTKEGAVRRFAELLEEQDSNEDDMQTFVESRNSTDTTVMQEKIVDDFFITEHNQENYKGNHINALPSDTKSYKYNAQAKAFPSSNRFTKQSLKCKNDTKFSQNYNKLKYKPNMENNRRNRRYLDKESFLRTGKRESNKINKGVNKNYVNDIKITEENVNLHPSWLAKKKQQEIMSQSFQGKKIVFTDD